MVYTHGASETQLDYFQTPWSCYEMDDTPQQPESPPQVITPAAEISATPQVAPESASRDDKFRKARIIKFFPQSSYGFVRDEKGHEIYFHLDEVRLAGSKDKRSHVVEGAEVGIDVGRTSRGLRVTTLKIY